MPLYEKKGARLTLTALALKAAVVPLKKHPIFNASLDESTQEIVYKDFNQSYKPDPTDDFNNPE